MLSKIALPRVLFFELIFEIFKNHFKEVGDFVQSLIFISQKCWTENSVWTPSLVKKTPKQEDKYPN